jgi:hypothetical protein
MYVRIIPFLLLGFMLLGLNPAYAQDNKEEPTIRFNGLGRAGIQQTGVEGPILENDTTTARNLADGEFLLDLAINAAPNEKTEIQSILRLRNEFGGFFGSGVSVEVRELWARGLIGDILRYRVGDMDVAMTPYTFFNFQEEGVVNEADLFAAQREVIHYEQFYSEGTNTRRVQGAKFDFGLESAQVIKKVDFSGFAARVRGTDFFTQPSRYTSGANATIHTFPLMDSLGLMGKIGLNLAHTWDDLQSGEATTGIRNTVYSINFDIDVINDSDIGLSLQGETGNSSLSFKEDTLTDYSSEGLFDFFEINATLDLKKQGLSLTLGYQDIGPDFFSIAAQSRRIDFEREKTFFNRLGVDRTLRMPSLFDMGRDRALYTYQLSDRLMPYDPRYSNTRPYGQATANRRGVKVGVQFKDKKEIIDLDVTAYLLSEIRGQGTTELKDFQLIRAKSDFYLDRLIGWKNQLKLSLGVQYEQTSRDGLDVEQVDLSSTLIDAGLTAELFPRFDLLLGAKILSAEGNEYIPRISEFNQVEDFPAPYIVDDTETLLGAGIRYRFKEGVYITCQYQRFSYERATDTSDAYDLDQLFVLYSMDF